MRNPAEPVSDRFDLEVLAAAVETADALIIVTDLAGTILRFNPACERLTGWSADAMIGRNASELLPPGERHHVLDAVVELLGTGRPQRSEGRWLTRRGEERTISFTTTVLAARDGFPPCIVATGVDVTDERRATAALASSERRHRALVEHASDIVVVIDAEGTIRYLGPSGERVLGWRPEEVEGTSGFDLVPASDRPLAAAYLQEALAQPGPSPLREFHVLDRRGRPVLVESVASNQLHDPDVNGLILHMRDITERRRLEASARLAEARFRQAFERAPNGIALVALDGLIVEANQAFAEMLGREVDEVCGSTFQALTHPEDLDADLDYLQRLLDGDIGDYRMEKRYLRPDGTVIWALLTVSALPGADGRPAQLLSHVEDITDRKSLTEELAHLAHHDGLTGLPNRTAVHRRIDEALARRHLHDVGVLFVDLDAFKGINDRHGHDVGDAVLAAVGRRLSQVVRPSDLVGRVGGDEFVVVVEPASTSSVELVTERVLASFVEPVEVEGCPALPVGATIGGIIAGADDDTSSVLRRADEAMYRQKPIHAVERPSSS